MAVKQAIHCCKSHSNAAASMVDEDTTSPEDAQEDSRMMDFLKGALREVSFHQNTSTTAHLHNSKTT